MESVEFGTEDLASVDFVDELLNLEEEEKEAVKVDTFEEEEEEEEEQENDNEKENSSLSSSFRTEAPPVEELSLPAHDVAELEWVSRIMDESLSEFPTYQPAPQPRVQPQPAAPALVPVKAKRSKRTRTPSGSWSSWGPLHHTDEDVTTASSVSSSSSASYSSQLIFAHHVLDEIPAPPPAKKHKPKKRGRKPKNPGHDSMGGGSAPAAGERRCSHCGVNKTPQWRTGPNGAKTLCNACGVRYKSGRLLPEYRPACSPTFVSHVHSNSHRKVLEMRRKKEEQEGQLLHVPVVASF